MWARGELRARWRSWLVLGLLAGATAGIAAAAVAGARRTDEALPRYVAASGGSIDAAVLANDPTFDARQRAAVAALPEVRRVYPFSVPFLTSAVRPRALGGTLLPQTAGTALLTEPVIVEGRHTNPARADEATIDETAARRHGLHLGSTIDVAQVVPLDEPDPFAPGVVSGKRSSARSLHRVASSAPGA